MADETRKVGIEYVVEGMSQFVSDTAKAGGVVNSLIGMFDKATKSVSSFGGFLSLLGAKLMIAQPEIGAVVIIIGELIQAFAGVFGAIGKVAGAIVNTLVRAFNFLVGAIKAVLKPLSDFVGNILYTLNPLRLLGEFLRRIMYVATGILVADVIRGIGNAIKDMAAEAFKAASDFQLLKLRLEGLLARDIVGTWNEQTDSIYNYADALAEATKQVPELFAWITKLAIQSPFNIEDVSTIFTMAKAYNITTDMAKRLTEATLDFAAGMGLTGDAAKRVVENIGQMIQQGKITGMELRDLARGAFVPIASIFDEMGAAIGMTGQEAKALSKAPFFQESIWKQMATNLGVTTDEMERMGDQGLIPVTAFTEAFIQVVKRDFQGAAQRMTRTFYGLGERIKDAQQALLGFLILGPGMTTMAERMSTIFDDIFQDPRLAPMVNDIGTALNDLVTAWFPTTISGKSIMDFLTDSWYLHLKPALQDIQMGHWLDALYQLGIPKDIVKGVEQFFAAWDNIGKFFDEEKQPLIDAVGEIVTALGLKDFIENISFTNFMTSFLTWTEDLVANAGTTAATITAIGDAITHFITVTIPLALGKTPVQVPLILAPLLSKPGEGGAAAGQLAGSAAEQLAASMTPLDEFAKKIHALVVDIQTFATNIQIIQTTFGPTLANNLERISTAFERIGVALGINQIKATPLDAILGQIARNAFWSTVATDVTATLLERVATALDTINAGVVILQNVDWNALLNFTPQGFLWDTFMSFLTPQPVGVWWQATVTRFEETGVGKEIKKIGQGVWDILKGYFTLEGQFSLIGMIITFVGSMIGEFTRLNDNLIGHSIIPDMLQAIYDEFVSKMEATLTYLFSLQAEYYAAGAALAEAFAAGLAGAAFAPVGWTGGKTNVKGGGTIGGGDNQGISQTVNVWYPNISMGGGSGWQEVTKLVNV